MNFEWVTLILGLSSLATVLYAARKNEMKSSEFDVDEQFEKLQKQINTRMEETIVLAKEIEQIKERLGEEALSEAQDALGFLTRRA